MNTNYIAPQIEVVEIEIEDAVLGASGTEDVKSASTGGGVDLKF